jgi:hypothetical protein
MKKFKCHYRERPARSVIKRLVDKFYETGSVLDQLKGNVGAKRTARTEEAEQSARAILQEDPRVSISRLAQRLGVSWSTTYRIVRGDIGLFPYKIHILQQLTELNKENRLKFAVEFTEVLSERPRLLNDIWFTDECHFWMNGYVNKQNTRLWSDSNPFAVEETQLHPQKITVWAAFSSHGIIGPVFIRETVTSASYNKLLSEDVIPELEIRGHLKKAIFQQDGAKPHTSDENLMLLRKTFKKRVISNRFPSLFNCGWRWPPYSPDLNPCDYFLWGYLKDRVYRNNPTSLEQLEAEIIREMRDIPAGVYELVVRNFINRLERVIEADGGHFENRQ